MPQDTTTVNLGALPTVPEHDAAQLRHPAGADRSALDQPAVHAGAARCARRAAGEQPFRIHDGAPAVPGPVVRHRLRPERRHPRADGAGPGARRQLPRQRRRVAQRAVPRPGKRRRGRHSAGHAAVPDLRAGLRRRRAISGRRPAAARCLQLDPTTGAIVNQFGDGVTLALAVDPKTDQIYVSTGKGVEIFDPTTDTFTQYSRDQNLRVSSLAFDADGNLWAVTWPDARQVVEFDDHARAQVKLTFDSDIQSIAFGQQGTHLENLLFVSHDDAPNTPAGTVAPTPSELTMVDVDDAAASGRGPGRHARL